MRIFKSCLATTLLATSVIGAAHATPVEVRDGVTAPVRISLKDSTRVKVEDARITDVFGRDIQSNDNPRGSLLLTADKAKGEVFIQPSESAQAGRTSTVFVVTEKATYTLLAVMTDTPGDTLVLRDRTMAATDRPTAHRSPAHLRTLIHLVKAMDARETPPDVRAVDTGRKIIPLWAEARYVLERRVEAGGRWTGEVYSITNTSGKPMVLNEREFFTDARIGAISVVNNELAPGQSTHVYIVRDAGL